MSHVNRYMAGALRYEARECLKLVEDVKKASDIVEGDYESLENRARWLVLMLDSLLESIIGEYEKVSAWCCDYKNPHADDLTFCGFCIRGMQTHLFNLYNGHCRGCVCDIHWNLFGSEAEVAALYANHLLEQLDELESQDGQKEQEGENE